MTELILLCCFALLAGFIDAIAGGGGLIQLPAYFIFMPHFSTASLFGSNKFAGFSGTVMSTVQYLKQIRVQWNLIWPSLIAAGLASLAGARLVSLFDKENLAPVIVVLLILMLLYTVLNRKTGTQTDNQKPVNGIRWMLPLSAIIIGFYDGFFGPGAGSLLMFVFITLMRMDFLNAAAHTKVFNLVTNIGALLFFIVKGEVHYDVAIPVALCNITGSYLGVKLALRKGSNLIRAIYIVMVIALTGKIVYDYIIL